MLLSLFSLILFIFSWPGFSSTYILLKPNETAKAVNTQNQGGTEDGGSVLAGAIHTYIHYGTLIN